MLRQTSHCVAEIQNILNATPAKLKKEASLSSPPYPTRPDAQIVRISYVEGDVRIQRGEPNGKAARRVGEAVADLPL